MCLEPQVCSFFSPFLTILVMFFIYYKLTMNESAQEQKKKPKRCVSWATGDHRDPTSSSTLPPHRRVTTRLCPPGPCPLPHSKCEMEGLFSSHHMRRQQKPAQTMSICHLDHRYGSLKFHPSFFITNLCFIHFQALLMKKWREIGRR